LKRTATAIGFFIFYFDLEYLKILVLQSSEQLHTKTPPTSCFFGARFVEPFLLMAGALLFDEKIRCTILGGLPEVRIFQIFYSRAVL
jgi:hypothetical protein